jgi:O-antigen ligase
VVDGTSNTSAGARLEMWKASFEVIKENPIIGVGEDNYKKHQKELIDQGKISKFVGKFAHPHGEYITSLVEQGGIGLLAFILVLLMPIKYFLNHIKSKLYTNESTILVTPGLIIILHYLFYSVTSGVFDHQSTALFYSVFMAIIIGLIKSNSRIEV